MSLRSSLLEVIFRNYKIDINWSGFSDVGPLWKRPNMSYPFSRLYFVCSGSGKIKIKDTEYSLEPGNMYLIPSGTRFSYHCDEHFEHLFFHLTMDTIVDYDFLSKAKFASSPVSIDEIRDIINLYESDKFTDQIKLTSTIYQSIATLLEVQEDPVSFDVNLSPLITNTITYIKQNLSIQLTAKEISDVLHVSKTTLLRKFRNEIGMPLGQYIDKLIFCEATNKLANSTMSIAQISSELGFCDQFYFSQRFKNFIGNTPSDYRNNAKVISKQN